MAGDTPLRRELLARARDAERRASRKVQRNEAAGRHVAGSEYDPRIGRARLTDLTTRQLRSHLAGLEQFISRDTQFSGLEGGTPAPRQLVREFERLQRENNRVVRARNAAIDSLPLPGSEGSSGGGVDTVGRRAARLGDGVYRGTFHIEQQSVTGITNVRALRKLIKNLRKRSSPTNVTRQNRQNQHNINKMLQGSNMKEFQRRISRLTDDQKYLLFEKTNLFGIVREQVIGTPRGTNSSQVNDIIAQSFREREGIDSRDFARQNITELIDWAERMAPRDGKSLPNYRTGSTRGGAGQRSSRRPPTDRTE